MHCMVELVRAHALQAACQQRLLIQAVLWGRARASMPPSIMGLKIALVGCCYLLLITSIDVLAENVLLELP
jgi:hypothetical protein